jgi:hypothetical protein
VTDQIGRHVLHGLGIFEQQASTTGYKHSAYFDGQIVVDTSV